jgi:hypothetical protein
MVLTNSDDESFELEIKGYEYPNLSPRDDYDSNWLLINIKVQMLARSWTRTNPALLTWEVENLLKWLRDISTNKEVDPELEFIEPNVSFTLNGDGSSKKLRVHFDLEFKPGDPLDETDCFVDFPLNGNLLGDAVLALEASLNRFGQR